MSITIEELLNSMQTKYKKGEAGGIKQLQNSRETWQRIASKDEFAELEFTSDSEKEEFLKSWIEENPYSSI